MLLTQNPIALNSITKQKIKKILNKTHGENHKLYATCKFTHKMKKSN